MVRRRTLAFVVALAAFMLVGMVLGTYRVTTSSMTPTVSPGDVVVANHWSYQLSTKSLVPWFVKAIVPHHCLIRWNSPERNDVVLFSFPGFRDEQHPASNEVWLKRIVACAGDTITIRNASLVVNGVTIRTLQPHPPSANEAYMTFPKGALYTLQNYGPLRVPRTGDTLRLSNATDWDAWSVVIAREGHLVDPLRRTIDGRPALRYVVQQDYAFAIGDNHAESVDSRLFGPIPYANIFARHWATLRLPLESKELWP